MAAASKVITAGGGAAIAVTSVGYGITEATRTKFPSIREHLELSNFKILNPNESSEEWNKIAQILESTEKELKKRCKDLLETTFWTIDEKYVEASIKCTEEKTFREVLERSGLTRIDKNNQEHVEYAKKRIGPKNDQTDINGWFNYCHNQDNSSYRKAKTYEDFLEKFQIYINDCSFKKDLQETIRLSYWTEKSLPLSTYIEETTRRLNFIQFEDEKEWKKTLEVSMTRENKTPESDPKKLSEKIIQLKWECKRLLNTPTKNYTKINESEEFIFAVEKCTKLKKMKDVKWWGNLYTSDDEQKIKEKWDKIKGRSALINKAVSYGFNFSGETKDNGGPAKLLKICLDIKEKYANFLIKNTDDLNSHWGICSDAEIS